MRRDKWLYIVVDGKQIQVKAPRKVDAVPLYEAMGYIVTANHIHILINIKDNGTMNPTKGNKAITAPKFEVTHLPG